MSIEMIKLERILCPIDLSLSKASDEALRYAMAFARTYEAKLYVTYCAEGVSPDSARELKATWSDLEEVFKSSLARYGGDGASGAHWECVVTGGEAAADAITREASERKVNLIVMGSRRRPLRAALLGSTAETVCRTAPCPVLVTHPQQRGWVGTVAGEINLRRVLIGEDFSAGSKLALAYGLSLAQEYQAELHLLHVLPREEEVGSEISWESGAEGAYHKAARRLQESVPADAYLWSSVKHTVRWGKPYREILAYAAEQSIDLILIGAHGAGFGVQTLFGSNTDRVLRQAPCPVFVARERKG